jgi:hypothetical protein
MEWFFITGNAPLAPQRVNRPPPFGSDGSAQWREPGRPHRTPRAHHPDGETQKRITAAPRWLTALVVALALSSCIDQGIVNPSNPATLPPLASFRGIATSAGDSVFDSNKLLHVTRPRVALIWQFYGIVPYASEEGHSAVEARLPFTFTFEISQPPPAAVLESDEPVLAGFWLYNDTNDNGRLDRVAPQAFRDAYAGFESLRHRYDSSMSALRHLVDRTTDARLIQESYHVGAEGRVYRGDTLVYRPVDEQSDSWYEWIATSRLILSDWNRWESFFGKRKRLALPRVDYHELPDGTIAVDAYYRRRLFPRAGTTTAFEERLNEVTRLRNRIHSSSDSLQRQSFVNGWLDYPYTGVNDAGQDWVIGRTRWYVVLYIPTDAQLEQIREAARSSAFVIDNRDRLHRGYNLFQLDDQYRCRILDWSDTVFIELGERSTYFNPPTSSVELPVHDFTEQRTAAPSRDLYEGAYSHPTAPPLTVASTDNGLWARIPEYGVSRLRHSHDHAFFVSSEPLQFQFVLFDKSTVGKVFTLAPRWAGKIVSVPTLDERNAVDSLRRAVALIRGRPRVTLPAQRRHMLASRYDSGDDTITLSVSADSFLVSFYGLPAEAFVATGDSRLSSRHSDIQITFDPLLDRIPLIGIDRGGIVSHALNIAQTPFSASSIARHPPTNLTNPLIGSTGSRIAIGADGGAGFAAATDSFVVQQGDGAVVLIDGFQHVLHTGGDRIVFALHGHRDEYVGLRAEMCSQSSSGGSGRALFTYHGGRDRDECTTLLMDPRWVDFTDNKATIRIDPIAVTSDSFYIELVMLRTRGEEVSIACDSYLIATE